MKEKTIEVKESKFGKGVFANKNFSKGELITMIKGKTMGLEIFQSLKEKGREALVDPFQIGKHQYIDVEEPYLYLNHSCNPNAGIKGTTQLFAIKNIKEGEEIFFDYSTAIDEGLDCKCGSTNCRHKIGDFFTLPKEIQKKYLTLEAVPDFIKNKVQNP